MSKFTKEVTVEEFWKQKYLDLADKYEALQVEYNAAAKQANMHPLLQEPDLEDIDTGITSSIPFVETGITPDTKWGDLDPELGAKLDRMQANEEVDF